MTSLGPVDEDDSQVVAQGENDAGASWSLWASRKGMHELQLDEGELLVMMRVTSPDGRSSGEGGGGGELPGPDHMISIGWSVGSSIPRSISGYVHPNIHHLELTTAGGDTIDIPLYDSPDFPEVHFAALLVPDGVHMESIAGFDQRGHQLARIVL